MSIRLTFLLGCAVLAVSASPGTAQPPSPLESPQFPFPGSVENPASGISAGTALADQWLGDEPFSNPATPPRSGLNVAPSMVRMSRQDLRADNRNYDESPAFFDGAGGALGLGGVRSLAFWIYAFQPVLRIEDNAYTRGTGAVDPGNPPAALRSTSSAREMRGGLAVSAPFGSVRIGAAVELTNRTDDYDVVETSGSPEAGLRHVDFSGSGVGFQLGGRWEGGERWVVGAGARFVPALTLEGEQRFELLSGDSLGTIDAERESGWEAGASARYFVSPEFSLLAAGGGRTAQDWNGLGVTSGAATTWRIGLAYHDAAEPWSVRFGVGQDDQNDVPEPRATLVGLGFGFDFDGVILDLGAVRRSMSRDDAPTFYDDRVVASVRIDF